MRVYASLATLMALRGEKLPAWMLQTAYLLTRPSCSADCAYCWLAGGKQDRVARLARVTWYPVELEEVLVGLQRFKRVCIQSVVAPGEADRLLEIVRLVVRETGRPVSVAVGAVSRGMLRLLRDAGVDEIGVGLDAATPSLAKRVSRPYTWAAYVSTIVDAVRVFGEGRVHAHLIIGLGEDAVEAATAMRLAYSIGARVALFPYTPAARLGGRPPSLCYYRGAQLYRQLLEEGLEPEAYIEPLPSTAWRLKRDPPLETVARAIETSGCTWCNRPFYTESPRGPIYNTPWRASREEAERALGELRECRL